MFGQTYMAADGGLAEFDDLKLRAQAGWHDVDFAAETAYRQLSASGVREEGRLGLTLSPSRKEEGGLGIGERERLLSQLPPVHDLGHEGPGWKGLGGGETRIGVGWDGIGRQRQ